MCSYPVSYLGLDFLDGIYTLNEDGCWIVPSNNLNPYGRFWYKSEGKNITPHIFVYETIYGKVPDGLELDHVCRNRACCNPLHLEAVTHKKNCSRGLVNQYKDINVCIRGHVFDAENTYVDKRGFRSCKECQRVRNREYEERKKDPFIAIVQYVLKGVK